MNIKTIHDYKREYDKIIRDAMTEAWDRGYWQGVADERMIGVVDLDGPARPASVNPYKEES